MSQEVDGVSRRGGVHAVFSIKRSLLCELDEDGLVESVSLRRQGRTRERLFNVESIRQFLREQRRKNARKRTGRRMNSPKRVARMGDRGRNETSTGAILRRLSSPQLVSIRTRSSRQILRDISCLRVYQQPYGQIFCGIEEAISRLADGWKAEA
jgi:hypothetical protein